MPDKGALVIRENPRYMEALSELAGLNTARMSQPKGNYNQNYTGGGNNYSIIEIKYGDISIVAPDGTAFTPDTVKDMLDRWTRQNPPTRTTRNFL